MKSSGWELAERNIKNGYHTLAIDENRKEFSPTLWTGQPAADQNIEQRWFSGAHSNVGGGYTDDQLSNIALAWMCDKASACGLRFKHPFQANANDYHGEIHDSYADFMGAGSWFYRLLHPRCWRGIDFGTCCQKLDQSPITRLDQVQGYKPKNLLKYGAASELVKHL